MSDSRSPEWQKHYCKAALEVDQEKRTSLITVVEEAASRRLRELQTSSDGHAEAAEIQSALSGLSALKNESLDFK